MNQGPSIYDPLIYMDRSGTKSYHLFNHLGTTNSLARPSGPPWRSASGRPSHLASAAQALTDTYRWNAWGVGLASTGSTANPFGYVGKLGYYKDADQGLLHVGARRYHVLPGRFDAVDPVRVDALPYGSLWPLVGAVTLGRMLGRLAAASKARRQHPYVYCANMPTASVDPSGEQPLFCLIGVVRSWVRSRGKDDKYRHCVMGCIIARYCGLGPPPMGLPSGTLRAAMAAYLKEIKDILGRALGKDETPDVADIKATLAGAALGWCLTKSCERACKEGGYPP